MEYRVGAFEKVSYERFVEDESSNYDTDFCPEEMLAVYKSIKLPQRATSGSAGYDIYTPYSFMLDPGESIIINTGIRVSMVDGWFLNIVPRSGMGFKYNVMLANTVGVIDGDYYCSDNEGHIKVKLINHGNKTLEVEQGKGIAQAIFLPYGVTYTDDVNTERNGGFGSTGM